METHLDGGGQYLDRSLVDRTPSWPGGAVAAASITIDVDVDSMMRLQYGSRAAERAAAMSWLGYDRIGLPRLLRVFRERGMKQTFFFPGWCMQTYPELVESALADGHEIGLHGYLHEVSWEQSSSQEEEILERGIEVAERLVGERPVGWRAPLYGFSDRSAELLASRGFVYDASLMGDDVPYLLRTPAGDLIELPSEWANDDWPQYAACPDLDFMMQVRAPSPAREVYEAELEAACDHGSLWITVWHPHVSGRLSRIREVIAVIDRILDRGDVWLAPLRDIADHVRRSVADGTYEPRVVDVERVRQPVETEADSRRTE